MFIHAETRALAQQWFARLLADDCDDADRVACEEWRNADPAHDAAFCELERIWDRSAGLQEDPAVAAAVAEAMRPASRSPRSRRKRWPVLAAAASIILASLLVWWGLAPEAVHVVRYQTALGEQRTVTLNDGSTVVLDTDTRLLVRFGKDQRDLVLRQGRADFNVHRDASKPFVVHVGKGSVTALGTRFQVRVEGGDGIVTLLRGRIRVAASAQPKVKILDPGERIVIGSSGRLGSLHEVSSSGLANTRGWTDGNLVVDEWSLQAVVAEMNRYSDTRLRLGDPTLRSVPVSGVFKVGDQKSFVLALEYGWPIRATWNADSREIVLNRR